LKIVEHVVLLKALVLFVQVASRALGIPVELIYTNDTSTEKIPNATLTGGSMGTDIYAPAVLVCIFTFPTLCFLNGNIHLTI
jgi:hypothetical protein